jgi:hypothetical protein
MVKSAGAWETAPVELPPPPQPTEKSEKIMLARRVFREKKVVFIIYVILK